MKKFLRYILMLISVLLAASFWIVRNGDASFPNAPGPHFHESISQVVSDDLAERQPDMILMGDSVVELNLNPAQLERELGQTIYPIHFNGSSSTLWYLAIKNSIAVSPNKPKYLVVVFRDTLLTNPVYRTKGKYQAAMDLYATPQDILAIQRAYLDYMNPLENLGETYLPLYARRANIRSQIDFYTRYPLSIKLLKCNKRCMDTALDHVLNSRQWIPDLLNSQIAGVEDELYTRRALDFHGQLEHSFLPDILRICRENDIRLILVHAKTLRLYKNAYEPALLERYLHDMADYLKGNGVSYLDMDGDARIRPEDFSDSIHIFPSGVERYTQTLADALKAILP